MEATTTFSILCCLLAQLIIIGTAGALSCSSFALQHRPFVGYYYDNQAHDAAIVSALHMAGGWGKRKKDLTPEESARGDGVSGERRGFDAYELQVTITL